MPPGMTKMTETGKRIRETGLFYTGIYYAGLLSDGA
jgi:hypothetical protein